MSNSIYSNGELMTYTLSNESLWKDWTQKYSGSKRIIKLTNLNSGSFYRIKYKINSRYTTSQYSEIKLIPLKRANTKVNIFVQGTGRNNHDNAIVTLNNKIILKYGKFQGLSAITLNRKNLSVSSIEFFDTYNENTKNETNTVEYIKYSYDKDGNIVTSNENTTIKKLNPKQLIGLVKLIRIQYNDNNDDKYYEINLNDLDINTLNKINYYIKNLNK